MIDSLLADGDTGVYIFSLAVGSLAESNLYFLQLIVDAMRWGGSGSLMPGVSPFKSSPVFELLAHASLLLSAGFDGPDLFPYAMLGMFSSYVWTETGFDAIMLIAMLLLLPGAINYAIHAFMLLVALQLLQPRRHIPRELWIATAQMPLLVAAYAFQRAGHPFLTVVLAWLCSEIASYYYAERAYGPCVWPAAKKTPMWLALLITLVFGVNHVDARAWHAQAPTQPSTLPAEMHTITYFCNSRIVRAVRIHTGRVIDERTVAIWIGSWDEMAFARTVWGGLASLLFSLRLPLTLRARLADDGTTLEDVRLVAFFFETPPCVWRFLTRTWSSTDDSCVMDGDDHLVASRTSLRRVSKLVISGLLATYHSF